MESETELSEEKKVRIITEDEVDKRHAKHEGHRIHCSNRNCNKPIDFGDDEYQIIDRKSGLVLAVFHHEKCLVSLKYEYLVSGRTLDYAKFQDN